VLGIDPGTAVTGYGVVEQVPGRPGRLVECGVIRTSPRQKMWTRLDTLYEGVRELITRHRPSAVAIESVFQGKNARSALTLGHARGVILLAAARARVDVAEFAPASVKRCVAGRGRAMKVQVSYMVQQLLRLTQAPTPSDAADGIAVALTYLLTDRRQPCGTGETTQSPAPPRGRDRRPSPQAGEPSSRILPVSTRGQR
jgi:crossover junction endodeoxyribonuclease RuvC